MDVKAEDGTVEEERQRVVRSEARRAKPEAQREEERRNARKRMRRACPIVGPIAH
jgi:hypothetical protein